jgi:preprotein translocase subunit SecF
MKRVIQFSRARYFFFGFSALLILIGIGGFVVNHGLNLGVDFKAGIAFQFQIAPASFTVLYTGTDKTEISIPAGEQALTSPGDIIFTTTNAKNGTKQSFPFRYADYKTVRDLMDAIGKVPGVVAEAKGDVTASPTNLLPLPRPANITGTTFTINMTPGPGRGVVASISDIRSMLPPLGEFTLQAVGAAANQEFITRVPVMPGSNEATFQQDTEKALLQILEGKYGAGQVILKSTEFVGARMAQSLVSQTIWLVIIAVALILLYMILRFHPAVYGIAAVLGIIHDAFIMLSFDAVFRVEIDAGTIAAILTILGYSINDTIVNFDRARENNKLMRGSSLRSILDTSVTQTLGRTFITSGATLLTVIALFILTTGTIKNFALNMIVGIVEGTYSTFISAFIVIEWTTWRNRKHKAGELAKYGIATGAIPADELDRKALAQEEEEAGEEVDPEVIAAEEAAAAEQQPVTAALQATAAGGSAAEGSAAAPLPGEAAGLAAQSAHAPANAVALGHSGSRKNKKHKRRHH